MKTWDQPMKVILFTPHEAGADDYPGVAKCALTASSAPRELARLTELAGDEFFYWIADAVLSFSA